MMNVQEHKSIWKYPLNPSNRQVADEQHPIIHKISVPIGFRVLKCAMQHGYITLWIFHDTNQPSRDVEVVAFGTGWDLPLSSKEWGYHFIDTVFDGEFVWHVFIKFKLQQHGLETILKAEAEKQMRIQKEKDEEDD